MADFSRAGSMFRLTLDEDEATLLGRLFNEMKALLKADLPRAEPVTGRLFPNAYESSDEQAAFDELIGDQLRSHKHEALERAETTLQQRTDNVIEMAGDDVDSWLTVVNDLRLAIGTRLDVTEETMNKELDTEDPDAPALSVLHWLGWVQESMLKELTG